ncbi:MAG: hypothetical protein JRI58_11475 [Deltaproteobacteria bacterium]|nr:hypothetical protein [Deltaproteobacteria bacterium]MBW2075343.1 hypothetical protein [Deltaproteobacteria bacterium]
MNDFQKLATPIVAILFFGLFSIVHAAPKLNVVPDKIVLSPALFKKPIAFTGSGYQPKETVVVDLVVPQGIKMKGLTGEEKTVGIAFATADEKGNFKATLGPMTTLNTLFQVGWTPLMKPDFKKARPLPPGKYEIVATGIESERVSKAILELLPPPKKK